MGDGCSLEPYAISINSLKFEYPGTGFSLSDFSLNLKPGSRCLLIGANGAGKTTLLRILAGKHLVGKNKVLVLGRSAFHDLSLTCDGDLAYLGGSWTRTVGSAGEIPLQGDFSAEHMIFNVKDVDPQRRERLIELLDIDLEWRMHKVSDGQRRRVQICMGLLRPFKVLLLDEVTVDLDVVARLDLLQFFVQECEERQATVVYATHIFDGLETWATHLAYLANGKLEKYEEVASLDVLHSKNSNLLGLVEPWLRQERAEREEKAKQRKSNPGPKVLPSSVRPFGVDPFASSRQMAWYR